MGARLERLKQLAHVADMSHVREGVTMRLRLEEKPSQVAPEVRELHRLWEGEALWYDRTDVGSRYVRFLLAIDIFRSIGGISLAEARRQLRSVVKLLGGPDRGLSTPALKLARRIAREEPNVRGLSKAVEWRRVGDAKPDLPA